MFVCSIIILAKTYKSSPLISGSTNRRGISRNKQLFFILFATNSFFVCSISPLVCSNLMGNVQENNILATVTYILAYSNHALVKFIHYLFLIF
jgi:hypothetical protein